MTCHDHIFIVIAMTTSEMANVSVVFSGHFSWICETYGQFSRFFEAREESSRKIQSVWRGGRRDFQHSAVTFYMFYMVLPSGRLTFNYGKSPFLIGKKVGSKCHHS